MLIKRKAGGKEKEMLEAEVRFVSFPG